MAAGVWITELALEERELLSLFRRIRFGSIEDLRVRAGLPVLDPPPTIIRELRMKGESPPKAVEDDFQLRDQMLELLAQLRKLGSGTVRRIEVLGGVPHRLIVEGLGE